MYRAKAAGRGRVELFDNSMREQAIARLQLESDLRGALPGRQLFLEYQPVVERRHRPAGRGGGAGALEPPDPWAARPGRVHPPGRGDRTDRRDRRLGARRSLDPARGVAACRPERAAPVGLGERLGPPARRCRGSPSAFAHLLRELPLAPRQRRPRADRVVSCSTTAIPPACSTRSATSACTILLDDFGTGYSSLAYLERFPIDALKIDRSFVMRLEEGNEREAVLQAIFTMANALGLEAIAEGRRDDRTAPPAPRPRLPLGPGLTSSPGRFRPRGVLAFLSEQATLSSALGGGATG